MMKLVERLSALEILDSRGNPTILARVHLSDGTIGQAMVPSGASTGSREAKERRDGDKSRYLGKGVLRAVEAIETEIQHALHGMDALQQAELDALMCDLDGSENKSRLGANAILGVSMALADAAARACGMPLYRYLGGASARLLPVPLMNILNGGVHADNNLGIQEFMVLPLGASTFREALRWGSEIHHTLRGLLKARKLTTSVGDEGGFAPDLDSNEDGLALIQEAIQIAGFRAGEDVFLGLDCAASELYDSKTKKYSLDGAKKSVSSLLKYYEGLAVRHPLLTIEDGLAESDWNGWKAMTDSLGSRLQIVGDDIFVTDSSLLTRAIGEGVGNAILIKLNQIGTVTETMNTVEMAHKAGYRAIISHRSGETEDTFIADLAVATGAGQIKCGAPCRADRTAKYNRLLQIEWELGAASNFAGRNAFAPWISS